MQRIPGLFAVGLLEKLHSWSATTGRTFQTLVFFGVFAVIILVAFGWAIIFRQQPLRRHHRSHSKPATTPGGKAPSGGFLSRRQHKHRRNKHRPTNPTLAETGGLPAARNPNFPPKSPL